jgi:hypothetical protein
MFCKMNWEDLNLTIPYSYLQLCSFYAFLIISRWRLNSYNGHSKVLGDVSMDTPIISCKWTPRNILWTKENKNKITLMNIIDVNIINLLNQIEYNIVHIPSKLPFLTFHQVFYQDLTNYFIVDSTPTLFPFLYSSKLFEKTTFISIF